MHAVALGYPFLPYAAIRRNLTVYPAADATVARIPGRSIEAVVELPLCEHLFKIFHLHLGNERFSAPAAARLGTSTAYLFIKNYTKLNRPLEDMKELT